jgi:hypothetical protein
MIYILRPQELSTKVFGHPEVLRYFETTLFTGTRLDVCTAYTRVILTGRGDNQTT